MFPLFRLDRLSIDIVLKSFTPVELLDLSLCSKATFQTLKSLTKGIRNCHMLDIDIHEECKIHVMRKNVDYWSINVHNISELQKPLEYTSFRIIKGILLAAYYENGDMNTYWVNEHQGFKLLIEHLTELYNLPLEYLSYIDDNDYSDRSIEIIDWINKRQKPIKTVSAWFKSGYNQENFDSVLDRLKSVEELTLEKVVATKKFIRNHKRKYEFKSLIIQNGYWVTLPRLLTMNCVELKVYDTELSDADVNVFLKSWIRGSCSRLKCLTIEVDDLDFSMILSDVPYQVNEERLAMLEKGNPYYDDNWAPVHCDIRRLDGTIATVFYEFKFSTLRMRVWD